MLIGHSGFGDDIYRVIYSFHMPLFFLLSGYLYTIPDKKKLLQRSARVLVPYMCLGCFYVIIQSIIQRSFSIDGLKALLWDNSKGLPIESALWFLTATFVCQTLYTAISITFKNKIHRLGLSAVISLLTCVVTNRFGIVLPFSIQAGIAALIYFSIGDCLKKVNIAKTKTATIIVLAVLLLSAAYFLPLHNMRTGSYGIVPITELMAASISILLIIIAQHTPAFLKKPLLHYGQNSIIYLGINHLGIKIATKVVSIIGIPNKYVTKITAFALTILLLYCAVWVINSTPLSLLFFKKHKKKTELTQKQSNGIIG